MKKARAKRKTKTKNEKSLDGPSVNPIKIDGWLDNLIDYVKQVVYREDLTLENITSEVMARFATSEPDKLEKDIKRCLGNSSFFLKDGLWQLDKRGNPDNDHFYQWLTTMGHPVAFFDLKALAAENGLNAGELKEHDLVHDGRFIRLRNGKWALTHWQIIHKLNSGDLAKITRVIQTEQRPLTVEEMTWEVFLSRVDDTNLLQMLNEDPRFTEVGENLWYLQSLLEAIIADITAEDVFFFARQGEISVLQEAELMLIIKDADVSRRQYILSSLDLEKGTLRLNKRLSKMFGDLEPVSYLFLDTKDGLIGAWYLREQQCLAGLGPWFEARGLEPGSKLEISRSDKSSTIQLKASGEREAEVFTEGLKMKRLASLKKKCTYNPIPHEELVIEILQLYPQGLDYDTLLALAGIINGCGHEDLKEILNDYPYFEQTPNKYWRCNQAMRHAYHRWQQEMVEIVNSLEYARREVSVTAEEVNTLQSLKENLEGELAYLQNHHREEEALYQEKISDLAMQNEHQALENSRLKSDCQRLGKKQKELLDELEHQSEQLVMLRGEKNKLKVKLEQSEAKAMQLQSSLNKVLEDAREEINRLNKQLLEKKNQTDSLKYANQELQKNMARLHEERRELKRRISSWPVRIAMVIAGFGRKKGRSVGKGVEG